MKKHFTLFVLYLFILGQSFCQVIPVFSAPKKSEKVTVKKTSKPQERQEDKDESNLRVITSAPCFLVIDEEAMGLLRPNVAKSFTLSPGRSYRIQAVSSTNSDYSFDEYIDITTDLKTISIPLKEKIQEGEAAKQAAIKSDKEEAEREDARQQAAQQVAREQADREEAEMQQKARDEAARIEAARQQAVKEEAERQSYLSRPDVIATTEITSMMIVVGGGDFTMGNNAGPNDESPEHYVTLGRFALSKREVTQKQWTQLMGVNPSSNKCDNCPVENVSWNEVMQFISKINAISKVQFRLPTEAEWEYVATKGGLPKKIEKAAWFFSNSKSKTHSVGSLEPNALGIYDLFGNVAEWCSDWYATGYYKISASSNPSGPDLGKQKVIRGGSFDDMDGGILPTTRDKNVYTEKKQTLGFRLVHN